jgi:F-type H+-transporting ATPase subunit a
VEESVSPWLLFGMACIVMIALALFAISSTRRLEKIPTTRRQNLVELIVEGLNNFTVDIIGPEGREYTPFIGSLFIFILCANLLGLFPGLKSPTSSLSITVSLALIVFVAYNVIGIRKAGVKRYLKHLIGEPVWLAPLMFPIHVIGELARPLSLSVRLFGNMFGEEMVLAILASLTLVIVPYLIAIPTQFPIMLFDVFISFVQAMVFSMLSAIYISLALEAAEEH